MQERSRLVVRQRILLYLWLEGSRVNGLWLWRVLSFSVFSLGSVQTPHFLVVTDARQMCTNDHLSSFNHPLAELPVLGRDESGRMIKTFLKQQSFFCFSSRVVMCGDHEPLTFHLLPLTQTAVCVFASFSLSLKKKKSTIISLVSLTLSCRLFCASLCEIVDFFLI